MRNPTSTASSNPTTNSPGVGADPARDAVGASPLCPGLLRFRSWELLVASLILLAAPGCRTAARRLVSDPGLAIARLQAGGSIRAEADSLVKPLLASGEVYGMVVGVVTPDGKTQTFGYGRTGRPGDLNPPDGNSLFQIGSVSKLFTETLLVQLVQAGRLHYDDTVRSILPASVPVSADAGRLTLYGLATHTSGLRREPFTLSQLRSFLIYLVTGRDLYAHLTVPYCLDYLRRCHAQPKDPREFVYSNFGAGLLAYLIGVKMGRPAEDLILDNICRPLGMTNSVFVLNASQQERLTVGHAGYQACWKFPDTPIAPWDMGHFMRPISGMFSCANDLILFAKANLKMLSTPLYPALAATHKVQIQTPREGEALGWIVSKYEDGRRTMTFKDGVISGYHAFIGLDLDTRVAVVVLANKFDWDDKVGMNLLLRVSGAGAAGQMKPPAR
jgi:CubicO group peptidase (beta-lactamase class C family)